MVPWGDRVGATHHSRVDKSAPATFIFEEGKHEGDGGRPEQDDNQLVLELLEDKLPQRGGGLFGDSCNAIGSVLALGCGAVADEGRKKTHNCCRACSSKRRSGRRSVQRSRRRQSWRERCRRGGRKRCPWRVAACGLRLAARGSRLSIGGLVSRVATCDTGDEVKERQDSLENGDTGQRIMVMRGFVRSLAHVASCTSLRVGGESRRGEAAAWKSCGSLDSLDRRPKSSTCSFRVSGSVVMVDPSG